MQKYIYYGAGQHIRSYFENYRELYEPLCFCDRSAERSPSELFGLPVLPPSAMFEQYPNTPILITLADDNMFGVKRWLIEELGIEEKRIVNKGSLKSIVNFDAPCRYLNDFVQIRENSFILCCSTVGGNGPITVTYPDNFSPQQKVELMRNTRKRIKDQIAQGVPCECTGCSSLKPLGQGINSTEKPLNTIGINFHNTCNIRCCYCSTRENEENDKKVKSNVINVSEFALIIEEMKLQGMIDNTTALILTSSGEMTIHPSLNEFIYFLRDYRSSIRSNCVIFSEEIEKSLQYGKMWINCSVDAGTRETFVKVKGADCFDRVCNNLKRYALAGKVELKYIIVPGLNDNESDIDGFVKLTEDILQEGGKITYVCLVKDLTYTNLLTEHTIEIMKRFLIGFKDLPVKITIAKNTFIAEEFTCLMDSVKKWEERFIIIQ